MTRPNVTLQPSKRVVMAAAAQIYAAYVTAGFVSKDEDPQAWLNRSIQEAIALARRVDVSVQSDEELPDDARPRLRETLPETVVLPELDPQG